MAKQIIVLTENVNPSYLEINYLFWLSVPAAMQSFYANANAKSAWSGASAGEIAAIQSGSVLEVSGIASFNTGTTAAQMGSVLLSKFNTAQNNLNADTKLHFFGTYYDSIGGWTVQGVN